MVILLSIGSLGTMINKTPFTRKPIISSPNTQPEYISATSQRLIVSLSIRDQAMIEHTAM